MYNSSYIIVFLLFSSYWLNIIHLTDSFQVTKKYFTRKPSSHFPSTRITWKRRKFSTSYTNYHHHQQQRLRYPILTLKPWWEDDLPNILGKIKYFL